MTGLYLFVWVAVLGLEAFCLLRWVSEVVALSGGSDRMRLSLGGAEPKDLELGQLYPPLPSNGHGQGQHAAASQERSIQGGTTLVSPAGVPLPSSAELAPLSPAIQPSSRTSPTVLTPTSSGAGNEEIEMRPIASRNRRDSGIAGMW